MSERETTEKASMSLAGWLIRFGLAALLVWLIISAFAMGWWL